MKRPEIEGNGPKNPLLYSPDPGVQDTSESSGVQADCSPRPAARDGNEISARSRQALGRDLSLIQTHGSYGSLCKIS